MIKRGVCFVFCLFAFNWKVILVVRANSPQKKEDSLLFDGFIVRLAAFLSCWLSWAL